METSATAPTPAAPGRGLRRLGNALGAGLLALLVAAPLLATVWTRSTLTVRIPKGGQTDLENASYVGRDWSAALTALEVRQATGRPAGSDDVASIWTFHYTNSDREPHYVALTIRCLDVQRKELNSFRVIVTLLADSPGGAKLEQTVRMREASWQRAVLAKIVADFLSGPEG